MKSVPLTEREGHLILLGLTTLAERLDLANIWDQAGVIPAELLLINAKINHDTPKEELAAMEAIITAERSYQSAIKPIKETKND